MHFFLEHIPAGISLQQLYHFAQLVNSKRFQAYDYRDEWMNQQMYGKDYPPDYNLSCITAHINLFSSPWDMYTLDEDLNMLRSKLQNVRLDYTVTIEKFGHSDFVYSSNIREVIYDKLLSAMKEANNNL